MSCHGFVDGPLCHLYNSRTNMLECNGLHVASLFGIDYAVEDLMRQGLDCQGYPGSDSTALCDTWGTRKHRKTSPQGL